MAQEQQYDIITVGGGIAGSAFAAAMASTGASVLVLESETEFRDRVRGEWLAPWGYAEVRALGLEAAFEEAEAQQLPALAGRSGKPRREATPDGDVATTFSHPALQEALLRRASDASATVVRGARVRTVTGGPRPRVTFEVGRSQHTVEARLVVGADGRSSVVRRALGALSRTQASGQWLAGTLLSDVEADSEYGYFILGDDGRGAFMLFPQADGRARAYVLTSGEAAEFTGPDAFDRFVEALVAGGVPASVLARACQAGPLASFRTDLSWIERPAGNGLALIGDAAGLSDPTWGMGLALSLRDARTLAEALASEREWVAATAAYATERTRYFEAVVTAEQWQNELLLTSGPAAEARRRRAQQAWRGEPSRMLRLPVLGPTVDVSKEGRARFFGDDLPADIEHETNSAVQATTKEKDTMTTEANVNHVSAAQQHSGGTVSGPITPPAAPEAERRAIGDTFVHSLINRDFATLYSLLGPTMRMRSLLAHGHEDFHGSEEVIRAFGGWFGGDFQTDILRTNVGIVGDRLLISFHFRIHWPAPDGPVEIEQTVYAKVQGGRIVTMDLLCSGYRPATVPTAVAAADAARA